MTYTDDKKNHFINGVVAIISAALMFGRAL